MAMDQGIQYEYQTLISGCLSGFEYWDVAEEDPMHSRVMFPCTIFTGKNISDGTIFTENIVWRTFCRRSLSVDNNNNYAWYQSHVHVCRHALKCIQTCVNTIEGRSSSISH